MIILATRLLDFTKPSLMNAENKGGNSGTTCPSPIHSISPCKPYQRSRIINPPSHPKMARDVMLVTPLEVTCKVAPETTPKVPILGNAKQVDTDPQELSGNRMHDPAARACNLESVYFHCYHPNSIRRVPLPKESCIRSGSLLLTNLSILKTHYITVET